MDAVTHMDTHTTVPLHIHVSWIQVIPFCFSRSVTFMSEEGGKKKEKRILPDQTQASSMFGNKLGVFVGYVKVCLWSEPTDQILAGVGSRTSFKMRHWWHF